MKIVHIITGLNYGGAEKLLLDTCIGSKLIGNEVEVIYLRTDGDMRNLFNYEGIKTTKINLGRFNFISVIIKLIRYIKINNIDIVHTHLTHADLVGRIAAIFTNKAYLNTLHSCDEWRKSNNILLRIYSFIDKKILEVNIKSKSIAISNDVKKFHIKHCKYKEEKIVVIKNCIDIEKILNLSNEKVDDFSFKVDKVNIISIGRLEEVKGQDLLIKAIDYLINIKKINNIQCLIIGTGSREATIKQLSNEYRLNEYVKFIGRKSNPYKYMKSSDLVIVPSRVEGFGLVVLEALITDNVVIASRVNAIEEIIQNNKEWFLFNPNDYIDLGNKIEVLINNIEQARRLNMPNLINLSQYDINKYCLQISDIYKKIR